MKQPSRAQTMAVMLAGKVAELNLGQYSPELLKLAVRQAVNPAEAASHLREIQVGPCILPFGTEDSKTSRLLSACAHLLPLEFPFHVHYR